MSTQMLLLMSQTVITQPCYCAQGRNEGGAISRVPKNYGSGS